MPKRSNTKPMWQKEKAKKRSLAKKLLSALAYVFISPPAREKILEQRLKYQTLTPYSF